MRKQKELDGIGLRVAWYKELGLRVVGYLRTVRGFWLHYIQLYVARYRQYGLIAVLTLMVSAGFVGTATATQTSSSTHYSVTETQFGTGSSLHDCSTSYCAKTSTGDTAVGSASSANYSAQLGSNTTDEPLVEVTVTGGNQDLGTVDSTAPGTAIMLIKVRDYLTDGYVMEITGAAPSQGTHTLNTLTTPSTSQPGAEQFGINMVANNNPAIGANPVQVPSGSTSFGTVEDDYITPDLFKYVEGDPVASSSTSSGETDYTMSLIMNVSHVTPAGHYSGTYSAVVVPMY